MASLPSLLNCATKRSLGPSRVRLLWKTRSDPSRLALPYKTESQMLTQKCWSHPKVSCSFFHSSTTRCSDTKDQKPPTEPTTASSVVKSDPEQKELDALVRIQILRKIHCRFLSKAIFGDRGLNNKHLNIKP